MGFKYVEEDIKNAWSALSKNEIHEIGWKIITLSNKINNIFQAGIHFPERLESILIGFDAESLPKDVYLPEGKGFSIQKVGKLENLQGVWFALTRKESGDFEMFCRMAVDILNMCYSYISISGDIQLRVFINRIKAWQNFMGQKNNHLSQREQIGICGELDMILCLLHAGISHKSIISYWKGPLGFLHDFEFPSGALEIKSTISSPPLITITSVEQLDTNIISPLFLSVFCYCIDNVYGKTILDRVVQIQNILSSNIEDIQNFNSLLLHIGVDKNELNLATNKYHLSKNYIYEITEKFPAIISSKIQKGIVNIKYSIDISYVDQFKTNLHHALKTTGVA